MSKKLHSIFGAPGCGKTRHLLKIVEMELENVPVSEIAFVSFTKKGTYEGVERIKESFHLASKDMKYFRTIHSLAFMELGMSKHEVISKRHFKDFSKAMGMKFVGFYTEDFTNTSDDKYLFYCSLKKNNPEKSSAFLEELNVPKSNFICQNYDRFKKVVGVKDFDDILIEYIEHGEPLPIRVAIIDEAQDLTTLQWKAVEKAFQLCERVYVAGDDDQAIYEWSGSDVGYFHSIKDKSHVVILDKSYRLKKNILDFSKQVVSMISKRVDKRFDAVSEGGDIHYYNSIRELLINNEDSYYFLARSNYHLTIPRNYLRSKALVFYDKGELSVKKNLLVAISTYETFRRENRFSEISGHVSIIPFLNGKVGLYGKVPWYEAFSLIPEVEAYYRDLIKTKNYKNLDTKIMVNTIHGVKGGEADHVVLILDVTKRVYDNMFSCRENYDSELRILYVALTRAKKSLHIVHSSAKLGYDGFINFLKN